MNCGGNEKVGEGCKRFVNALCGGRREEGCSCL